MTKTTQINLSNLAFNIEQDGYVKLKKYLESIEAHFASSPDQQEILADVENSLADKFCQKITTSKTVITTQEVQEAIDKLGQIEDFDFDEQAETTPSNTKKLLFRDLDGGLVAGVCSGLAHYFGLNVWLIRLITLILIISPLNAILIYLALWLVVPKAETVAEKLQMKGQKVDIKSISQNIENEVKNVANKGASYLDENFPAIQNLVQTGLKILQKIAGFGLSLFSIGIGIILSIAMFIMIYTLFTMPTEFRQGLSFTDFFLIGTLFVFTYSFLLWILTIGLSLLKNKWVLNLISTAILLVISIGSLMAIVPTMTIIERNIDRAIEQSMTSKEYDFSDFAEVKISNKTNEDFDLNQANVTIKQSDKYKVVVSGFADEIDNLKFETRDGALEMQIVENNFSRFNNSYICIGRCNYKPLEVTIKMPNLQALHLENANYGSNNSTTTVTGLGFAVFDDFDIDSTSNLQIIGFGSLENLDINLNSSSLEITDFIQVENLNIVTSESNFSENGMIAQNVNVKTKGDSNIRITATKTLNIDGSGNAFVRHRGNPEIIISEKLRASVIVEEREEDYPQN